MISEENSRKKPGHIDNLLWCNSCQAIVREMLIKINGSTKEWVVILNISNVIIDI